jgi:hypothetical protein
MMLKEIYVKSDMNERQLSECVEKLKLIENQLSESEQQNENLIVSPPYFF